MGKTIFLKQIPVIAVIIIAGCIPFRPEKRTDIPSSTPSSFSMYSDAPVTERDKWWLELNNSELNSFIEMALTDNLDLKEAYARLKQANAARAAARSALFPSLSGSAGYDYQETENRDTGVRSDQDTFSLGLAASYEVDLWGRVRSLNTAGNLTFEAAGEDLNTSAMTITARIAELWLDIIATRQEIKYLNNRIRINEALLTLLELRFENGLASAMDILHQRESLASIKSQLPILKAQDRIYENELALLLGSPAGQPVRVTMTTLPDISGTPKTGIPADLLSLRPDVRSAGLKLKAADWEVSAAKADRLPALSLSASGAFTSDTASDLFSNWVLNLAANLTGPIFDAGRRKAEVDRVKAVAEERIATYEKTVLTAISEVENGMVREDSQRSLLAALTIQLEASKHSLREATRRYRTGQDTYINMEEKLLNVQTLEAALIRQKATLVKYRVALYRSLGGTWNALSDTIQNR